MFARLKLGRKLLRRNGRAVPKRTMITRLIPRPGRMSGRGSATSLKRRRRLFRKRSVGLPKKSSSEKKSSARRQS